MGVLPKQNLVSALALDLNRYLWLRMLKLTEITVTANMNSFNALTSTYPLDLRNVANIGTVINRM